ncbi:MAG: 1-deoxy-D-xylulose-5-phosphate reductoisomerase [Candidatus Hydrothermales bacterium]
MRVFVFGATGSIGKSFFSLVKNFPEIEVVGIQAHKNEKKLVKLKEKFKVNYAFLTGRQSNSKDVIDDREKLKEFVTSKKIDRVLFGAAGVDLFDVFFELLEKNKVICMANKEIIVAFGEIIKQKNLNNIIPVDSEHSSIFRIIKYLNFNDIEKIILTASGGPFYNIENSKLAKVKVKEALKHPRWKMGKKITIDSATLINKGFEIIEAHYLFGIEPERIEVLYHPQSKIHGLVLLRDGTYIAHISEPDMRIPILNALFYPEIKNYNRRVDKFYGTLNFEKIKKSKRKLIDLCLKALKEKKGKPAYIVGADEELVRLFLMGKIKFNEIEKILYKVYKKSIAVDDRDPNEILKSIEVSKKMVHKELG